MKMNVLHFLFFVTIVVCVQNGSSAPLPPGLLNESITATSTMINLLKKNLIPFFQHEMSENERTMMIQNRKIELGTFSYHTGDVGSVNSNGALVIDPDHLLFVVKIPFLVPQDSVLLSDLNGVLHEMEKRITDGFSVMFGSHPPGHYKIKEDVLNGLDSTHFFIAEKATSLKKNNEHKMEVLIDVNMILHESQYTKLG